MPTYRGCPRRGRLPVPAKRWKRRWSRQDIKRLRELALTVPLTEAAVELKRTFVSCFRMVWTRFGGVRKLAMEEGLVSVGRLQKIMRKKSTNAMERWIDKGLPIRTLGGVSNSGGSIHPSKGHRFVKLTEVVEWLKQQPRLLILLDPDVRRMLRIQLPQAA